METIGKIRRRGLRDGESISGLARSLQLSQNTVRKYLKEGVEPVYKRKPQAGPQLGPWCGRLDEWLRGDGLLPKTRRRTARRLFECLQAEGYAGAYDSVQRHVRQWKIEAGRATSTKAFVSLFFASGDVAQFDWSYEHVVLGGTTTTIKLAHFRLAYSRQMFVVAYPREAQEMVLDAHNRAFAFFGGVPRKVIYDNLKTVVDAVFAGKEPSSTGDFWHWPAIIYSNLLPALLPQVGRKARSRTRSAMCVSGYLRPRHALRILRR